MLRDAHLGSIWEGTSNIVALDVARAVRREDALTALQAHVTETLDQAKETLGEQTAIADSFARTADFLDAVANTRDREIETRAAASAVYNASSAAFLAWEDSQLRLVGNKTTGDRLAIAQNVLRHKLSARDPYAQDADEADLAARLLSEDNATLEAAQ